MQSGTTTYTYDVRGNLVRVDLPGGDVIEYLVDGQDRRVGKKKNGVLERAWLYRNQLNPVAELDGAGALVARFVYGSRSNVPEYLVRGGVTYRVLSDHLGSPRALVDVATGTVAWRADFDAWGNRTLIAGTADFLPFGFAGGCSMRRPG
jgi:YD repeat-containing protein